MAQVLVRSLRGVGIALILMLSGCFRPASDTVQPTAQSNAQSGDVTDIPSSTDALPPITLIAPPVVTASQSDQTVEPVLTLVTVAPATPTEPLPTQAEAPTIQMQIITPGMSLGLLTPDATTLPVPTAEGQFGPEETDEAGNPVSQSAMDTTSAGGIESCLYTVEAGDSLYAIAVSQNTTVDLMLEANPDLEGDPPILQIGQVLELPACIPSLQVDNTEEAVTAPDEATLQAPEGSQIYVVQSGDVLGAIATRFGVSIRAIMQANDLTDPDQLSVGQRLIIPPKAN